MITAPCGSWPSPISAADVTRGGVSLEFAVAAYGAVWWQERRPDEGGRTTIVRDGTEMLAAPWYTRSRVHEYGGRSYLPLPDGGFVFANLPDQRLYLVRDGAEPEPLTADNGDRYADLALSPDGGAIWCVRERHSGAAVSRAIAAVPLSPGGMVRELVTGADFFAFPTPSPDGRRLAWIDWDHPRMPWDGTSLRVAPVPSQAPVRAAEAPVLMGGPAESVLAPTWGDESHVYAISDISGWWNLYLCSLDGAAPRPLCPRDEEFAEPLWQLGGRPFAVLADGRLAVSHGHGEQRLAVLDPASGELTDLDLPYRAYSSGLSVSGMTVATVGAGPADLPSVIAVNAATGSSRVPRAAAGLVVDRGWLPEPVRLSIDGVHALLHPPASPEVRAPDGELPPYVVRVHGGPTSAAVPALDPSIAYFTSRGIGVAELNYGGSSGYGRAYRDRLRGQWGVVDVADAYALAAALASSGRADPKRLAIRGGSAGGWTVLAAVTTGLRLADGDHRVRFAAAVSYYGIADLRALATDTHDFESRYVDGLVGPLPSAAAAYAERSPLGHVTADTPPVLLLQGLQDPVVPPTQSEALVRELAASGVPHAYVGFAGEAHGFRRAETMIAALEAELSFYGQVMGFDPPGVPPLRLD